MTSKTLPAASTHAAFLAELEASDDHIVDRLIKERCPSFVSHWSWPVIRPVLYSILGYDRACRMADYMQTLNGGDSFDHLTEELSVDLTLNAIERMPKTGRLVVAANHPTGLADGVAVWDALRRVRRDIVFFANADALRVNPGFSDVLIPVEWSWTNAHRQKHAKRCDSPKKPLPKKSALLFSRLASSPRKSMGF